MSEATITVTPAYEIGKLDPETGMATLRAIFPEGAANYLNLCLFSTSGTHGSYLTIEEIAASLDTDEPERLTVLVVQPRVVRMLYGEINVARDDIAYLLKLRESTKAVVAGEF